jgi:hypothetical protein
MADSNKTVTLVLQAKNEASAVLKQTQTDVGGLSSIFSGFNIGVALAGASVIAFGKSVYESAQQAYVAQTQLNQVLTSTQGIAGVTAQSANELAQSLMKVTNMDDEAIIGAESMLLTFTKIGKDVFPMATERVLDLATAMNGGMTPSAEQLRGTSIQLGKALNDPINGINALRRVGVSFTEGQREMIEKLVETGKTADAQRIILNELATEFGGSARANIDPMVQMKNALGEVKEVIGAQLLPYVKAFGTTAVEWLNKVVVWIENDAKGFNYLGKTIGGTVQFFKILWDAVVLVMKIFGDFGATMISAGKIAYAFVSDAINNFFKLGDNLKAVFKAIGQAMSGHFDEAKTTLTTMVKGALTNTIASVKEYGDTSRFIGQESSQAWQRLAGDVNKFGKAEGFTIAKAEIKTVGSLAQDLGEMTAKGTKKASDELKKLGDAYEKFKETVQDAGKKIDDALTSTAEKIKEIKSKILDLDTKNAQDQLGVRQDYAKAYVDQEKKVAEATKAVEEQKKTLADKLSEQVEGDSIKSHNAELARIQQELTVKQNLLNQERTAFEQKKTIEIAYHNEVESARKRASLTEFERVIEDLNKKQMAMEAEYQENRKKAEAELKLETEKQKKLKELQAEAKKELERFLLHSQKVTVDSINSEMKYWKQLSDSIASAKAGKFGGGSISTSAIDSRLNSLGSAKAVNITISNNQLLDEKAGVKIGDQIIKSLKMNNSAVAN